MYDLSEYTIRTVPWGLEHDYIDAIEWLLDNIQSKDYELFKQKWPYIIMHIDAVQRSEKEEQNG